MIHREKDHFCQVVGSHSAPYDSSSTLSAPPNVSDLATYYSLQTYRNLSWKLQFWRLLGLHVPKRPGQGARVPGVTWELPNPGRIKHRLNNYTNTPWATAYLYCSETDSSWQCNIVRPWNSCCTPLSVISLNRLVCATAFEWKRNNEDLSKTLPIFRTGKGLFFGWNYIY